MREQLRERGVAVGTLWRLFKSRKTTRKKVGACREQRGDRGARSVV
jgi:hypothetical protein